MECRRCYGPLPELVLEPGGGATPGNLDELGHAGAPVATLHTVQLTATFPLN
jgi:hypothetical protein